MRKQGNILFPDMITRPTITWRDKLLSKLNRIPFWIPMVSVVIIICTFFVVRNVKQINENSESSLLTRAILPEEDYLLYGIYSFKSLKGDDGTYSTAEISGSEGFFYITIYSDYYPLNLEAVLLSNGTLRCEGLGDGSIVYKPSTGSINIVFTKENTDICEFSK